MYIIALDLIVLETAHDRRNFVIIFHLLITANTSNSFPKIGV